VVVGRVTLNWFADCILNCEWYGETVLTGTEFLCDVPPTMGRAGLPLATEAQRAVGKQRLRNKLEVDVTILPAAELNFWATIAFHGTGKTGLKIRNAVYEKPHGQVWSEKAKYDPRVWDPFKNSLIRPRGVGSSQSRAVSRIFAEAQQLPAKSAKGMSLKQQEEIAIHPIRNPGRINLIAGFTAMQRQHDGGDIGASRLFQHSPTWKED
jgi:hypothetical protein